MAKEREQERQKVQAGSLGLNSNAILISDRPSWMRNGDALDVATASASIGFANSQMMTDAWPGPAQTAQPDQGVLLRVPPRRRGVTPHNLSNSAQEPGFRAQSSTEMPTISPPSRVVTVTIPEDRVDDFRCDYGCGYSGTYDAVFQHEKICAQSRAQILQQ